MGEVHLDGAAGDEHPLADLRICESHGNEVDYPDPAIARHTGQHAAPFAAATATLVGATAVIGLCILCVGPTEATAQIGGTFVRFAPAGTALAVGYGFLLTAVAHGRVSVVSPLYDLSMDPLEEHNLAHPTHADEQSHALARTMLGLLTDQLAAKRLTPSAGVRPGYQPPATANSASAPVGEPSSRTGEPLEAARSYRPERELTATHPTRRTQERHHDQRTLHPYQMDRRSGGHTVPAPARWMTRGRSLHG